MVYEFSKILTTSFTHSSHNICVTSPAPLLCQYPLLLLLQPCPWEAIVGATSEAAAQNYKEPGDYQPDLIPSPSKPTFPTKSMGLMPCSPAVLLSSFLALRRCHHSRSSQKKLTVEPLEQWVWTIGLHFLPLDLYVFCQRLEWSVGGFQYELSPFAHKGGKWWQWCMIEMESSATTWSMDVWLAMLWMKRVTARFSCSWLQVSNICYTCIWSM